MSFGVFRRRPDYRPPRRYVLGVAAAVVVGPTLAPKPPPRPQPAKVFHQYYLRRAQLPPPPVSAREHVTLRQKVPPRQLYIPRRFDYRKIPRIPIPPVLAREHVVVRPRAPARALFEPPRWDYWVRPKRAVLAVEAVAPAAAPTLRQKRPLIVVPTRYDYEVYTRPRRYVSGELFIVGEQPTLRPQRPFRMDVFVRPHDYWIIRGKKLIPKRFPTGAPEVRDEMFSRGHYDLGRGLYHTPTVTGEPFCYANSENAQSIPTGAFEEINITGAISFSAGFTADTDQWDMIDAANNRIVIRHDGWWRVSVDYGTFDADASAVIVCRVNLYDDTDTLVRQIMQDARLATGSHEGIAISAGPEPIGAGWAIRVFLFHNSTGAVDAGPVHIGVQRVAPAVSLLPT